MPKPLSLIHPANTHYKYNGTYPPARALAIPRALVTIQHLEMSAAAWLFSGTQSYGHLAINLATKDFCSYRKKGYAYRLIIHQQGHPYEST